MEGSGDLRVCRKRQQLSENSDAEDRKLDLLVGELKWYGRPLNLPTLFTVRATPFYTEIGLSHSEICVRLSQSTRFRGTKHV